MPEELDIVDGLVIPGGESTTMFKLARIFGMFEPLQHAVKGGLPTFGTCAGMIMLADRIEDGIVGQQTLGGLDVVVRRNAFGRQVDSFEAEVALDSSETGPAPFHARLHPRALGRAGRSLGRRRRPGQHGTGRG